MERHPSAARRPGEPTKFLILPSAALLLGLSIVPLMMLILFSFVDGNVSSAQGIAGFTLRNFLSIFQNATFSNLMVKSLIIALLVTVICILIAYPAAWAIAQVVHPRHRNLLIMLAIVPAFTSQLLLIHSIMLLLQAGGPIMGLLEKLGLAAPGASILYTPSAVVIILIYEYLPYMILCLYSCLEKIDMNVVNASHTLGAGRVRTFFNVVLPQSFPGLLAGILIVFIPVAGSFVEPNVAGGPYGMMVGSLIDSQFTLVLNMGYGAALSFLFLLVMALVLGIIQLATSWAEKRIGG